MKNATFLAGALAAGLAVSFGAWYLGTFVVLEAIRDHYGWSPEGLMGPAWFVAWPTATFLGGLSTGLLGGRRIRRSAGWLVLMSPGLYFTAYAMAFWHFGFDWLSLVLEFAWLGASVVGVDLGSYLRSRRRDAAASP